MFDENAQVQVGAKAMIVSGGHYELQTFKDVTVTRVTKTTLETSDGSKWSYVKTDYRGYGDELCKFGSRRDGWFYGDRLYLNYPKAVEKRTEWHKDNAARLLARNTRNDLEGIIKMLSPGMNAEDRTVLAKALRGVADRLEKFT